MSLSCFLPLLNTFVSDMGSGTTCTFSMFADNTKACGVEGMKCPQGDLGRPER